MILPAFCLSGQFIPSPCRRARPAACPTASALDKSESDAPSPPTTIESTITLASAAVSRAISAGETRLRISALIPGLNPLVEDAYPYSTAALHKLARGVVLATPQLKAAASCSLLFQSSGAAALASNQYAQEDALSEPRADDEEHSSLDVNTASYAIRDASSSRTSPDTNVIVAPASLRGESIMDALEGIMTDNLSATWLLLNPDLSLDRAAVGMGESTRRASFVNSFSEVFYFRNIVSSQCRLSI